jgi:hypothetical protein
MLSSSSYRSPFLLPNGIMQTPVSVGDLPSFDYQVPVETLTENVTSHLERHPEIPGVILVEDGKLHSGLPRSMLFERLGHRYGVELFLRKPILELQQNMGIKTFTISSNLSVKDAAQFALRREVESVYAPLVIVYDDGHLRLLDMHVLLYAQSHILDNANNVLGSMNWIEDAIRRNTSFDALMDLIVDSIARVVPYHRTGIFVKPSRWVILPKSHNLLFPMSDSLEILPAFKSVAESCQPVHLDGFSPSHHWQGMKALGKFRTWLGTPILGALGCEGVLSLGRLSNSPFTSEEMRLAKSFADYIGIALNGSPDLQETRLQLEKASRKASLWMDI